MRLTPKYKNGPAPGVNAQTRVVDSPATLVVKHTSTLVVRNARTLVLLGLLMTFWGCGKSEEKRPASAKGEPASTAANPQTGSASNAPAAPAAPAAVVIASADGEKAGTRVDITELKRSGDNNVTLKFAMVNDGPDKLSFGYDFADEANHIKDYDSIGGVNLVDSAGKKKYFVVRDTENACLCSRGIKDVNPKSRTNLWAKFPAPPDDVQKISIVIPHFGPIDDVPISR